MWTETDQYICYRYQSDAINTNGHKIASFDLDDTVIQTKSGKRFTQDADDWKFHQGMDGKIKEFFKEGYHIIIISNQKNTNKKEDKLNNWKKKIENITKRLNIPLIVYALFRDDNYRKPRTGIWDEFINGDVTNSFYCGDAGGLEKRRIDGRVIPRDFSDSDLKFALNVGMKFIHRDELVFGVKYDNFKIHYPIKFDKKTGKHIFKPRDKEMIINTGFAGCGKSSYTTKYILPHGYRCINQDTLKTANRCLKECEKLIKEGQSVVIDNTNPNKDTRKKYINLAKKYGLKVRSLCFMATMGQSLHNNYYRFVVGGKSLVPKIAYNIYNKKFEEPIKKEGFDKIEKIPFVIDESMVDMNDRFF